MFTPLVEFILNLLLLVFLLHFVWEKIFSEFLKLNLEVKKNKYSLSAVTFKAFGFTYLNPHVYSDTVFFLGNFSKDLILNQKILFGLGASLSSFLVFFLLGYASKYLSKYLKTKKIWKLINIFIIAFMTVLIFYISMNIILFLKSCL